MLLSCLSAQPELTIRESLSCKLLLVIIYCHRCFRIYIYTLRRGAAMVNVVAIVVAIVTAQMRAYIHVYISSAHISIHILREIRLNKKNGFDQLTIISKRKKRKTPRPVYCCFNKMVICIIHYIHYICLGTT